MKQYTEPVVLWIPVGKQDILTQSDPGDPHLADIFEDL